MYQNMAICSVICCGLPINEEDAKNRVLGFCDHHVTDMRDAYDRYKSLDRRFILNAHEFEFEKHNGLCMTTKEKLDQFLVDTKNAIKLRREFNNMLRCDLQNDPVHEKWVQYEESKVLSIERKAKCREIKTFHCSDEQFKCMVNRSMVRVSNRIKKQKHAEQRSKRIKRDFYKWMWSKQPFGVGFTCV